MNNCIICNKETKNKIYCSMQCRDVMRKRQTTEIRKCLTCNKEMEVYKKSEKKFCSSLPCF